MASVRIEDVLKPLHRLETLFVENFWRKTILILYDSVAKAEFLQCIDV